MPRRSLARQPVNPAAARLLGVTAAQAGDDARAVRLVTYSEAMSRRDSLTQLWLIQSAVTHGDVAGSLVHYDRALRTNNSTRDLLFPILAHAADEPAIWRSLLPILAARPLWERPFLQHYVPGAGSPAALDGIARALGLDRPGSPDPWTLQEIEKRLVDLGAYAPAAALYNRAHGLPAGNRTPLRNGDFEQPGNWDPFDWNLIEEEGLAALRQPSPVPGGGTALFPTATNGRGGDVAVQLLMLAPGRYAITATVGGVRGDPLSYPQLVVRCAADKREFLHQAFPPAPDGGRRWGTSVTIPADCPAQRIVLRAASALDATDAAPWIDTVAIRREG
jgi:hypothetical protein